MFQTDSNGPGGQSGPSGSAPASAKPPVLPPPLSTSAKAKLSPLAIAAIGVTGLTALGALGLLAAGLFVRTRSLQAREVEAREVKVAQKRNAEARLAQANGSDVRVTSSPRPVTPAVRETPVRRVAAPQSITRSEPGISYTNIVVPTEPWSIHVLKIDRSQKDLTFASAHAGTKVLGVSYLRDQAIALPPEVGRAVAAVNGDFYMRDNPNYAGDPRGLQITKGELISSPDTVCVWFDLDGNPRLGDVKSELQITWPDGRKTPFAVNQQRTGPPILPPNVAVLFTPTYGLSTKMRGTQELILEKEGDGQWLPLQAGQTYRARIREISTNGNARIAPNTMVLSLPPQPAISPEITVGAVVQISTATVPDLKGVQAAMGGGPALVKDGNAVFTLKAPPAGNSTVWSERSKYERNPRTAVGWNATHLYFVIVDGRQPGLSMGMKLAELAEFFVSLGCTDAMNLDGGKSAQMWMNGRILNSPCQGEDTVASSLLVVRKSPDR